MSDRILSNLVSFRDKLVYGDLTTTLSGVDEARQSVFGSSSPFLLSRFGNVEYTAFRDIFDSKRSLTFYELCSLYAGARNKNGIRLKSARMLRQNAGVYSVRKESDFDRFYEIYKECVPNIDFFFRWFSGDALLLKTGLDAQIAPLEYLNILQNPGFYKGVFEGKRLLVVSPHELTLQYQVEKKYSALCDHLQVNSFSLETVKTKHKIQSSAGDWFDDLDYLKAQLSNKRNVDYVILGCGAFGLPLACHAKELGISALHLGGVTQLLFGIMGARWEYLVPDFESTSLWTRPVDADRPAGFESIESGCYW